MNHRSRMFLIPNVGAFINNFWLKVLFFTLRRRDFTILEFLNHKIKSRWGERRSVLNIRLCHKGVLNHVYFIFSSKMSAQLPNSECFFQHWWVESSKKKQKLYEKFLKHKIRETELAYKSYKNLFESLKKKAKKKY